uniref:Uncharacterized protein n=1 Tax=Anguilla anguilla TaxID=7936 RepID=A0A0E9S6P7_ANGAN
MQQRAIMFCSARNELSCAGATQGNKHTPNPVQLLPITGRMCRRVTCIK